LICSRTVADWLTAASHLHVSQHHVTQLNHYLDTDGKPLGGHACQVHAWPPTHGCC